MKLDWETILNLMERFQNGSARFSIHPNGEILCRTGEDANCIADFIENLTNFTMITNELEKEDGDWYPYTWTVYPD